MQKSIAKQTDVKNKNSIGLKTMSFLYIMMKIYKGNGKSLTKALFNAII